MFTRFAIQDSTGIVYSGSEEEMRELWIQIETGEYTDSALESLDFKGDIQLIQIIATA